MANSSIPDVGTRVSVHMFARDLLAHQNLVQVETHPESGNDWPILTFSDGAGGRIAISGDRSSLRMMVSGLLEGLRDPDPDPDPDPPAVEEEAA